MSSNMSKVRVKSGKITKEPCLGVCEVYEIKVRALNFISFTIEVFFFIDEKK